MNAPVNEALKQFNANKLATVDRIRRDKDLTPSTRMIGAEIFSLLEFRTGDAWPSVMYLAEKLGLTDRTIKRATAALKKLGYIEVDRRGRSNRYRPVFEAAQSSAEQGTNCPLSDDQQGTECHLFKPDRGQKQPQQGTKTTGNRGQKRPPTSLETTLGLPARAAAARGGAPGGAPAPASDQLGGFAARLRHRLGEDKFASWLGKAAFIAEEGETLTLAAPSRFIADYLKSFYGGTILDVWQSERPHIVRLEVIVAKALEKLPAIPAATPSAPPASRVASLADRRGEVPAEARWLVEHGIQLVADHLRVSDHVADRTITDWLRRCGRDAGGLKQILSDAAAHRLYGDDFSNVVKQRTRALLHADQSNLPLAPVALSNPALKRSAS
jgi:DNA-binding transcriptional ArsR family regulator